MVSPSAIDFVWIEILTSVLEISVPVLTSMIHCPKMSVVVSRLTSPQNMPVLCCETWPVHRSCLVETSKKSALISSFL